MRALIILNSVLPPYSLIKSELAQADLIICADGGANRALAASIKPDYVIGDFDSINDAARRQLNETVFIHKPSQYATDLEKSLQFTLEKGVDAVSVIGFSGGRLDHQITNLNILQKFSNRLEISCIDENGIGRFVRDRLKLQTLAGQQISLIAFKKAAGITTTGLKYPITNGTLEWGVNDGQSNEAVSNSVEISVTRGVVFVFCVWKL